MQQAAAPGAPGGSLPAFRLGGREIHPERVLSLFSRTFFCMGPVCLRSGIGPGIGVGCGVGVIRGPMVPLGGEAGNIDFLRQLPGGYQIMNVLRTIMRKFPGSKTGVGCGVGAGFGFGIGLAPAGAGGSGTGMGSMMGGMGGGMMGAGGMGGGFGRTGVTGADGGAGAGAATSGAGGGGKAVEELAERVGKLEDKLSALEERVGVSLKMRELEERLSSVEGRGRRDRRRRE